MWTETTWETGDQEQIVSRTAWGTSAQPRRMSYSWRRGREAGLHAEAALLAQLLAMRCPGWNAAPLVYISWSFWDAFIELGRLNGKHTTEWPELFSADLPEARITTGASRGLGLSVYSSLLMFTSVCHRNLKMYITFSETKTNLGLLNSQNILCRVQNSAWESLLSSCAMRRRGSPPARWQVLYKGRPLAPSDQTCSQNRINTAHYPQRSSTVVCTLFYLNRVIIHPASLANKCRDCQKAELETIMKKYNEDLRVKEEREKKTFQRGRK